MHSVKSLVSNYQSADANDLKFDRHRMWCEILMYYLINKTEDDLFASVDTSDLPAGYTLEENRMNLSQKRRLRNQIYSHVLQMIEQNPDKYPRKQGETAQQYAMTHFDIFIDAFMDLPYGRQFANQRDEWRKGNSRFEEFMTAFKDFNKKVKVCIFSPYDPMFARSDAFTDNTDRLGYFEYTASNDVRDFLQTEVDELSFYPSKYVLSADDYGRYSNNSRIRYDRPVENEWTKSGYTAIARFINNNKDKLAVRNFLVNVERNGVYEPHLRDNNIKKMTEYNKQFMESVCEYMSSIGREYTICMHDADELVLKLANGAEIRLWHATDDTSKQGRIYDNGVRGYLGLQNSQNIGSLSRSDNEKLITNEDRLNAIKWYFGSESVLVGERDVDGKPMSSNKKVSKGFRVGQHKVFSNSEMQVLSTGSKGASKIYATRRVDRKISSDNNNSIMISYVNSGNVFSKDLKVAPNIVNFQLSPASTVSVVTAERNFRESLTPMYERAIPTSQAMIDESEDMLYSRWNKFRDNIDPKYIIPSDRDEYIDADGNVTYRLKAFVPKNHVKYYRHIGYVQALNDWLESAKAEHRRLMDFESFEADYNSYKANEGYVPNRIADEAVDDLRMIYWNFLSGNGKMSESDKRRFLAQIFPADGSAETEEAIERGMAVESYEEKMEFVNQHYDKYVLENFGTMPSLQMPDGPVVDNTGKGFNPQKVAVYSTLGHSYGVQKNHDYIRHMLKCLEDDYDPSWLPFEDNVSKSIKNSLIRYDENAVVGSFSMAGLSYERLFDAKGNVKPDAFATLVKRSGKNKMDGLADKPVTFDMMMHVVRTLAESGCDFLTINVAIDENGIIKYSGNQFDTKLVGIDKDKIPVEPVKLEGILGQIFEPDDLGVIKPKYVTGSNKYFIPGYNAYYVDNDAETFKSRRSRLRLSGWQHEMKLEISKALHNACFQVADDYDFLPHGASLNNVYKHSYDTPIFADEYEAARERIAREQDSPEGISDSMKTWMARIKTLKGRCRFPNDYRKATTEAQSVLMHPHTEQARNFNYYYIDLCDGLNLRVMHEDMDGVFDPLLTGTALNQGIVVYLVDGAEVDNLTCEVTGVECTDHENPPRCALMNDKSMAYSDFNSADRIMMSGNNLLTAKYVDYDVCVAFLSSPFTDNDAVMVSKRYADEHPVVGADGQLRPFGKQDKMDDTCGNKGVSSFIVDGTLYSGGILKSLLESDSDGLLDNEGMLIDGFVDADGKPLSVEGFVYYLDNEYEGDSISIFFREKQYDIPLKRDSKRSVSDQIVYAIQKDYGCENMDEHLKFFYENPHVDCIMSPYSIMSRHNGGSVVQPLDNHPEGKPLDYVLDGKVVKGGCGYCTISVLDMLADVKTHYYDNVSVKEGKGRNFSSQLAWLVQAFGAKSLSHEFYGSGKGYDNLREYCISVGLDFDENMDMTVGYHPNETLHEMRRLIKLPSVPNEDLSFARSRKPSARYRLEGKFDDRILTQLNKSGGFMEIPFRLDFKFDQYCTGDMKSALDMVRSYESSDDVFMLPSTGHTLEYNGLSFPTYGLPVLSSSLRSGQLLVDGRSIPHDYTNKYIDIYCQSILYLNTVREMQVLDSLQQSFDSAKSSKEFIDSMTAWVDELSQSENNEANITVIKKFVSDFFKYYIGETGKGKTIDEVPDLQSVKSSIHSMKATSDGYTDYFKLRKDSLKDIQSTCQEKAQSSLDYVVRDIVERRLVSKDGVIRDNIMSVRAPETATCVWSPDPRLGLDEVGISYENAVKLGLASEDSHLVDSVYLDGKGNVVYGDTVLDKDGNVLKLHEVLVSRDPILDMGQLRFFKPRIMKNVPGVVVHPIVCKCFQGDFDGDAAGLFKPKTTASIKECRNLLAVSANLLEVSSSKRDIVNPKTGKVIQGYPLFFESGLSLTAEMVERDEDGHVLVDKSTHKPIPSKFKAVWDDITYRVNAFENKLASIYEKDGSFDNYTVTKSNAKDDNGNSVILKGYDAVNYTRRSYLSELNHILHENMCHLGKDKLVFKDDTSFLLSLQDMALSGAKGNMSKMVGAAASAGIEYSLNRYGLVDKKSVKRVVDENGNRITPAIRDGVRRQQIKDVQAVASNKADGTQLGGVISQKGVCGLRDLCIDDIISITKPITQAILDSKHDIEQASNNDGIVRYWGADVWNGYKLSGLDNPDADPKDIIYSTHSRILRPVVGKDGKPLPVRYVKDSNPEKFMEKKDGYGNVVYEKEYVKCTKEEWITQMNCMYKALGVYSSINQDCLRRVADALCTDDVRFVKSAITGKVIDFSDTPMDKFQSRVSANDKTTVLGLEDFSKAHGSLLDRAGYLNCMNALVDSALKNCDQKLTAKKSVSDVYEDVRKLRNDICPNESYECTIAGDLKSRIDEYGNKVISAKQPKAKANDFVGATEFSNSASFVPNSALEGMIYKTLLEKGFTAYIDLLERIPRPVGRSDSFLSKSDYEAGAAVMGESAETYNERKAKIIAMSEARAEAEQKASENKKSVKSYNGKAVITKQGDMDVVSRGNEGVVNTEAEADKESVAKVS